MPVIIDAAILELVMKSLYLFRSARWAVALILLAALAAPGTAGVNPGIPVTNPDTVQINFVPVDNSAGGAALDGFVTTDIRLDFENNLVGSQLIINLEAGSFYRDPQGFSDGSRPNFIDLMMYPSLAFDTAVYGGGVAGGAIDIGGKPQADFPVHGGATLSQAWNTAGFDISFPQTDFLDIRLTLSQDATGSFEYLNAVSIPNNRGISFREGRIINGLLIPEPSTALVISSFLFAHLVTIRRSLK